MNIDLTPLHSHTIDKIEITNTYNIPEEYYQNMGVKKLDNVKVDGYIYLSPSEEDI